MLQVGFSLLIANLVGSARIVARRPNDDHPSVDEAHVAHIQVGSLAHFHRQTVTILPHQLLDLPFGAIENIVGRQPVTVGLAENGSVLRRPFHTVTVANGGKKSHAGGILKGPLYLHGSPSLHGVNIVFGGFLQQSRKHGPVDTQRRVDAQHFTNPLACLDETSRRPDSREIHLCRERTFTLMLPTIIAFYIKEILRKRRLRAKQKHTYDNISENLTHLCFCKGNKKRAKFHHSSFFCYLCMLIDDS